MPPSLSKFLVIVPGELDDSPPFYLKDWLLYKTPQWSPSSLSHLHHFRSFYKDFCTVCLWCQLDLLLVSFWWPDYSTWAARFPSWRSQRLLPWRQHLASLWPGSTAGRCCRHFHTNPGAPSGPGGHYVTEGLHLQIPPMTHAICAQHGTTKLHCGKLHLLSLISETSPIREAWSCDSGPALPSTTHRQGKSSNTGPHPLWYQSQLTNTEPISNMGNIAESDYSITSTRFQRLHRGKPHPETVLELSGVRRILSTASVTQHSVQVLVGFLSQAAERFTGSFCCWNLPVPSLKQLYVQVAYTSLSKALWNQFRFCQDITSDLSCSPC